MTTNRIKKEPTVIPQLMLERYGADSAGDLQRALMTEAHPDAALHDPPKDPPKPRRVLLTGAQILQRFKCRQRTAHLLKSGKLAKLPCRICGEYKTQAHHLDYTDPFNVHWLCRIHHEEAHHGKRVPAVSIPSEIPDFTGTPPYKKV